MVRMNIRSIYSKYFEIKESIKDYKPGYYYVEIGMNLLDFLTETCGEFDDLINEIYKNEKLYSNYKLKYFTKFYPYISHMDELNIKSTDRIVIALDNEYLLFGKSIDNKNNAKINYKWKKYQSDFFNFKREEVDDKKIGDILHIEGFFVFENVKKLNI